MRRSRDCTSIGSKSVGRDLELAVGGCLAQAFDKNVRRGLVPFANALIGKRCSTSMGAVTQQNILKRLRLYSCNANWMVFVDGLRANLP